MTDITQAKQMILSDWEKKRDELDLLISALRNELGIASNGTGESGFAPQLSTAAIKVDELVQPGDFFGMTQIGAAKEFLSRLNKRTASLNEIGAALYRGKAVSSPFQESGLKNLSSVLSRSEDLISVAKGRWGLTEWYPGRKKKGRKSVPDASPKAEEEEKGDGK